MLLSCVASGVKKPQHSIFSYMISNVIWVIHYVMLGALGGIWMSSLLVVRMGIGLWAPDAVMKWSVPFFIALSSFMIWLTFSHEAELFLLLGCILGHCTILYRANPFYYRIVSIITMLCWLVYHVFILSYAGIVNDVVQVALFVFVFLRHDVLQRA